MQLSFGDFYALLKQRAEKLQLGKTVPEKPQCSSVAPTRQIMFTSFVSSQEHIMIRLQTAADQFTPVSMASSYEVTFKSHDNLPAIRDQNRHHRIVVNVGVSAQVYSSPRHPRPPPPLSPCRFHFATFPANHPIWWTGHSALKAPHSKSIHEYNENMWIVT